jgi:hypothetical protein
MTSVLINRNFALLFASRFISLFGDILFDTTLSLWIVTQLAHGQAWAPTALGGVLLAALLPVLTFGSLAGVLVDRRDKRTLMLRMDAARALLIAPLLLLTDLLPLPFALPVLAKLLFLYLIVFLSSMCAQMFNPAAFGLLGDIVTAERQAQANGLLQMSGGSVAILAPPIATVLYFALGTQVAIVLNACSFLVSFLALLAVHSPPFCPQPAPAGPRAFLQEYLAGLRFLLGNRILQAVMIGALLAVFAEGAQQALGIFFYQQNVHAPLSLYGVMLGIAGAGLIGGSLLAALFAQRLGVGRVFSTALLCEGIVVIFYARTTSFLPACLALCAISVLVAVVNVAVNPLALFVTPKEMIGRISAAATSMLSLAGTASIALASGLAGGALSAFHATWFGLSFASFDTIFAATGVITIGGALYTFPRLWRINIASGERDTQERESTEHMQETGDTDEETVKGAAER